MRRAEGIGKVTALCLFSDFVRDAVECFGDGPGDGGEGIRITAEGNGVPHSVFKTSCFQRARNRRWHRALTCHIKCIVLTNFVYRLIQFIAVFGGDYLADAIGTFAVEREPDGVCRRPRAFHTFGMIVRDFRHFIRSGKGSIELFAVQECRR